MNAETNIEKGFSLIEILSVIVIISTMTALIHVSFGSFSHKTKLKTASNILKQTLTNSRLIAITKNRTIQHNINNNTICSRTKIKQLWDNWKCQKLNGEDIIYEMKGNIQFSPRGFATPKTILVKLNDLMLSLKISINGRIREEFN